MLIANAILVDGINKAKERINIKDTFTRENTTSGLGKTETGETWEVVEGNFKIEGNRATPVENTPTNTAVIDSKIANASVSATTTTSGNNGRLVFRYKDTNNYWYWQIRSDGYNILSKKENGTTTTIASRTLTYNDSLKKMKVVLKDNNIKCYYGDAEEILYDINNSFNQTASKHGIGTSYSGVYLDDFSVVEV